MSTGTTPIRVSPGWLALREPADAAARSRELVEQLVARRPAVAGGRWVIHDLGGGTGSMGRWLAPLLGRPQHWVVHDRDPDLLNLATLDVPGVDVPGAAAESAIVTVEPNQSDITRLDARDLAGADLITASALLDMLTDEELAGLVALCFDTGCPALLTLSVVGRVALSPADPLDRRVCDAFNDHQRRVTDRGALLGPDAFAIAVKQFGRRGADVRVEASPWRLAPDQADLIAEWFTGWVGAACEQDAELAAEAGEYTARRLDQARSAELEVIVEHADLLAVPRPTPSRSAVPRPTPSGRAAPR
jgi:hypothetical protein